MVYKGTSEQPATAYDLSGLKTSDLASKLESPNLTLRLAATHALADAGGPRGKQAVRAVRELFSTPGVSDPAQAHALWLGQWNLALEAMHAAPGAHAKALHKSMVDTYLSQDMAQMTWNSMSTGFAKLT